MSKLQPGQDGFVEQTRRFWCSRGLSEPASLMVIEYWGDGDPAFGGSADDRVLGPDGMILTLQKRWFTEPVLFTSLEAAHEAAKHITNRRTDSILGIAPQWR